MSKIASHEYKLAATKARVLCTRRAVTRVTGLLVAAAGAGLGFAPTAWAQASAADSAPAGEVRPAAVNAVWAEREFSFTYMGMGTYYSCDGLRNKIQYLLEQVGARRKPKVIVSCFDTGAVEHLPMARIRVAVPVEATPERLAELASDQSRRELVGRVQGNGAAVDTATAQFPAEWRVVAFDGRRGKRIEDSDCELLDQLMPQVLKPLGVRELPGSSLQCTPKQSQFGAVNLKLEALHAVKPPRDSKET
jgi:hypothetical protein